MIDLEHLETLAKAATPGPWEQFACYDIVDDRGLIIAQGMPKGRCEDFTYIAAANPAVVLELVAELRKARAALAWIAQIVVVRHDACVHPGKCDGHPPYEAECVNCWLKAVKEAVKND